jgi:hypothetical protein
LSARAVGEKFFKGYFSLQGGIGCPVGDAKAALSENAVYDVAACQAGF